MYPHLLAQPLKLAIAGIGGYVLYRLGKKSGKEEQVETTASTDK